MWLIQKHIKSGLLTVLCFITFMSIAQPPRKFYTRIGGNGYDYGYDIKQTLDNGYVITGSTSSFGQGSTDVYLLKLDSLGQIKFQKTFGNAGNEIGKSIVQLADSSFVAVGYTNSIGVGGYDIYLIKTDKDGNELWHKTYGGPDWDFAYSLQATTDGGFIIGGTTYSMGGGAADGYVIKTNANGDTTWTKTFGGINDDEFKSVIQTSDGNYALTGYTKSYNDVDSGDVWVYKLDVNGDSLWCKFYGGGKEDFGNQIIQNQNGDYFVAGATWSYGNGMQDGYALKIDVSGNLIWQQTDGYSNGNEVFNSVTISKKDSTISCYVITENFPGYGIQAKIWELKSNSFYYNGTEYGDTKADEIYKVISTKDKGYAGIGYTNGYGANASDVYFLKTDSNLVGSTSIVSVIEYDNSVEIKIFPNPCNSELNVVSEINFQELTIKLSNQIGDEINITNNISILSKNKIKINITGVSPGIYFLKIGSRVEKIIITD